MRANDPNPKFATNALNRWANVIGVEIDFSLPGKPTDNGVFEAFNGRHRAEFLNPSWFIAMADARRRIEE